MERRSREPPEAWALGTERNSSPNAHASSGSRHRRSHVTLSAYTQSRSHAYLFCVLSHGFSRKRETARSPGEKMMSTTNVRSPCLLLISKIMERAVQVQLVSFLTENNREARAFLRRGRQPEENISRGPGPYCVPDFYTTYL